MAGGLEKNIVLLANHLARQGNQVCLVTFDNPGATSFYGLESSVQWHPVGRTQPHSPIGFWNRLGLISRIRSILKGMNRPIVVCFHHGILPRFYLAAALMRLRIICSERNSITLYKHIRQAKWSLGFIMLSLANNITVQFPSYVKDYPIWLRKRIKVIHNPVYKANVIAIPDKPDIEGRFKLLTVGRLCSQKNQTLLIDAFIRISSKHPKWDLHIVGDGGARDMLEAHINAGKLRNRIFLKGKQDNIPMQLASAHIFCLPSKWEGFPNALAEAMAHGLPCVGLSNCAGVRDLIIDKINGLLVTDADLAQALDSLMNSPKTRKAMGKSSVESVSRYRPENAFRRWDDLLSQFDSVR